MARAYVQHEGKWNIFSTIIDNFLLDEFVEFDVLKEKVCRELIEDKNRELDTLLTERPYVCTMTYEEALKQIEARKEWETENSG